MALLFAVAGRAEAAMHHATGSFEVTMTPAPGGPAGINRMAMIKVFAGALAGTGSGEFLSAGSPAAGSAGYVAIERIDGTLDGRGGGFALMQMGTMSGGAPDLRVVVVPGSGTGALTGLTGTMTIAVDHGKHRYTLDYDLP
jgi:hypothetical protein